MPLDEYKSKRKFYSTPEPSPKIGKSEKGLVFVVQKHKATRLHYDFRLEMEGVLKSWAVPKGPSMDSSLKRLAISTEDHPYDYKDFEGVIPKGNYGAGTVEIYDRGTYERSEGGAHLRAKRDRDGQEDQKDLLLQDLKKGHISFILHGKKLQGKFDLIKIKNGEGSQWLLIKSKDVSLSVRLDQFLEPSGDTWRGNQKESVSTVGSKSIIDSKETVKIGSYVQAHHLKKTEMLRSIKPMLATLTDEPFDSSDFIFEIKWDGYRAIAEVSKYGVNIYSRNLVSFNKIFEPIVNSLAELKHEVVLDGEVVVLNEKGIGKFQLIQQYEKNRKGNLVYYVFDILYLDGHDLTTLPLIERKNILKNLITNIPSVRLSDHIEKEGIKFFELTVKQGLEGIIAKDIRSPYRVGKRTNEWLKIKTHLRQEAIIGGYTQPRGGRKHFGALVLGIYVSPGKKKLKYIGHTGGGFNEEILLDIYEKVKHLESKKSPFDIPPKTNAPVHWIKPKLVCEVTFSDWTENGSMRQPIFLGLREDKDPKEIVREVSNKTVKKIFHVKTSSNNFGLKLTNLDKIYFPEDRFTKGDVISYYKKISKIILPYLKDRPQSLFRMPNGINEKGFFQKDIYVAVEGIRTVPIWSESEDKTINYLICNDEKTLLYIANLGCIELNTWLSRVLSLEKADFMVLDLDPENINFAEVVKTARVIKKILDKANILSFCKTSGKRGLHILIPLGAQYNYDEIKQFGEIIAKLTSAELPKTTSVVRSPSKRDKKVYVDYLQNRMGQTITPPYSLRPVQGVTVSTPLMWEELNEKIEPSDFTVKNIFKRIEKYGDIFKPMLSERIDILSAIKKLSKLI